MNLIVENFINNIDNQRKYRKAGVYSISIKEHPVYIGVSLCIMDTIANHLAEITEPEPQPAHLYEFLIEAKEQGYPIGFNVIYEPESTDIEEIKKELLQNQAKLCERYFPLLTNKVCDIDDPSKWHYRETTPYHFDYWKVLYNLDNEDYPENQQEAIDTMLYIEKRKFNYEVKTDRAYFKMYPSTDPNKFVF